MPSAPRRSRAWRRETTVSLDDMRAMVRSGRRAPGAPER